MVMRRVPMLPLMRQGVVKMWDDVFDIGVLGSDGDDSEESGSILVRR
jgi:hypothetical protein